jgi:mannose-6-phosphate isomerase
MTRFIRLTANQPADRFYRGGKKIRDFRGQANPGDRVPEDWVGSTTTLFGEATIGLTELSDGRRLRDAVAADPVPWLGADHVARYGADTMLLVKLLDAGERLPVHVHPLVEFAHSHLGRQHGKAEAWCILDGGEIHLGFRREVSRADLDRWVAEQDTGAMLQAMHVITVRPGDSVYVPAGLPHAIGEGLFLVEIQEPEDLSILLEWKGFAIDGVEQGHLGLGFETALHAVDRRGWSEDEIAQLVVRSGHGQGTLALASNRFFRAERLSITGHAELEAGFSVVVVIDGHGHMSGSQEELELAAGDTILVPYAAGDLVVSGQLRLIRCRPPASEA